MDLWQIRARWFLGGAAFVGAVWCFVEAVRAAQ